MQIFSLMEQIDLILFMPCPGLRRHFTVNSFFYLKCLNFNWLVEKKPRLIIGRAHFPHRNKVWQMPSLNMGFHRRGAICWRSLSKRHSACGREGGGGELVCLIARHRFRWRGRQGARSLFDEIVHFAVYFLTNIRRDAKMIRQKAICVKT